MAGASAMVEAGLSAEFEERRAKWAEVHSPEDEAGRWALDRAVAASLRIETCERALEELTKHGRERARLAWDQDRTLEAATIAARLAREPVLASRQLETSWAGVQLLIDLWHRLLEALDTPEGWSDSDASKALDLLGIPADLRSGWTPIDGPEGCDLAAFRRELALEEVARLQELRDEVMGPLDELEHRQAMAGDVTLLSKPAKLVLRYERDAWRRYRESIKQVQAPVQASGPVTRERSVEPAPRAPSPGEVREVPRRAAATPARSFSEERRALLEGASMMRSGFADPPLAVGPHDEDLWLDEHERRIDGLHQRPGSSLPGSYIPIAAGSPASG
jgi:hypothetical protein